MSPITHFLAGWLVANAGRLERRDRTLVTLAGIAPDADALGVVPEILTRQSTRPLPWFSEYHHVLAHNLAFGLLIALAVFALARRRCEAALLALVSFHLHLLGDLAGARGPDGYQWPIPYLWPFAPGREWTWGGQWELNAWPNVVFTGAALAVTIVLALKRGYSPLEMISSSADRAVVETLRRRFSRGGA